MSDNDEHKDSTARLEEPTAGAPRRDAVPTVTERRPWAAPKLVILRGTDTATSSIGGPDGGGPTFNAS